MSATDWAGWLRLAVQLGIPPGGFWQLSLREWRWLTQTQEAQAMGRIEFEALARRFPDHHHARN